MLYQTSKKKKKKRKKRKQEKNRKEKNLKEKCYILWQEVFDHHKNLILQTYQRWFSRVENNYEKGVKMFMRFLLILLEVYKVLKCMSVIDSI